MGKNRRRRGLSANGSLETNSGAKGCFGKSVAEKKGYKPLTPLEMKFFKMKRLLKRFKMNKGINDEER